MNAQTLDLTLQRELPAATRGDQHAYGRIVLACQNTVTSIALAITRDVAASEDIAQEAFLKAWQQLDRLSNAASFLPWLRQITRNLARDHLRANRNRALTGERAEIAIGMAADPAPTPGQRLLQTEEEIAATEIISSLPEDSRETLLLYYREGQSSQQVASLLGLSDAAVRKRLSRARSSVREELLKRFGDFARASAPSAAFAVAVTSVAMAAAPAASAAVIIGASAVGTGAGKLGASGLGASAVNGGVAFGALGAVLGGQMHIVLPALIGGMLGAYLGGMSLLRFAENADERRQVQRFIYISTGTAALFCLGVLFVATFSTTTTAVLLYAAAGLAVINYQCLVMLPRIMSPMLARSAARRGRSKVWSHEFMYGRTGVVMSNIGVALVLAWRYLR